MYSVWTGTSVHQLANKSNGRMSLVHRTEHLAAPAKLIVPGNPRIIPLRSICPARLIGTAMQYRWPPIIDERKISLSLFFPSYMSDQPGNDNVITNKFSTD